MDYFYFCDCVIKQEENYFEDAHGNKIIGNYQGLKFAFSGFDSVIEIGENVSFRNTCIYVHSRCKVTIGDDNSFTESDVEISNYSNLQIGQKCNISFWQIGLEACASCLLEEGIQIRGKNKFTKRMWIMCKNSELRIGRFGCFEEEGEILMGENAVFKIGTKFSIQRRYSFALDNFTSIVIGNDCMLSYEVIMRSNDGHTIFDIDTGANINSTKNISQGRKIVIGNHVWIGMRSLILYGTKVGDGSIIGANSLVKKIIPNNCIAAGTPAKVIRKNVAWSRKEGAENIMDCGQEYIHATK